MVPVEQLFRGAEPAIRKEEEKLKWSGERLLWDDILEIVGDNIFEYEKAKADEWENVCMERQNTGKEIHQFKSYRDALKADLIKIMASFLEDFYIKGKDGHKGGFQRNNENVKGGF